MDSPFAPLQVNNTIRSFEAVSRAIDSTNAGDGVSLRVFCVCLIHRIERRTARVDLMENGWYENRAITIQTLTSVT